MVHPLLECQTSVRGDIRETTDGNPGQRLAIGDVRALWSELYGHIGFSSSKVRVDLPRAGFRVATFLELEIHEPSLEEGADEPGAGDAHVRIQPAEMTFVTLQPGDHFS